MVLKGSRKTSLLDSIKVRKKVRIKITVGIKIQVRIWMRGSGEGSELILVRRREK